MIDPMPVNMMMLREAIGSVSLSHPDQCRCTICRAALGDENALMAIILVRAQAGAAQWVDIRLHRDDVGPAIEALRLAEHGTLFIIDRHPVSSSPKLEWELQIEGMEKDEIEKTLQVAGIEYLAVRRR